MWCGEKQSEARRYRVLEGEGFNIKEESQARSWTQEDLLVKPEDVSPSGDGTASAKSPGGCPVWLQWKDLWGEWQRMESERQQEARPGRALQALVRTTDGP